MSRKLEKIKKIRERNGYTMYLALLDDPKKEYTIEQRELMAIVSSDHEVDASDFDEYSAGCAISYWEQLTGDSMDYSDLADAW
jgi:hypothetical protein